MWIGERVWINNWLEEKSSWDRVLTYCDDTMAALMSGRGGKATTEILASILRMSFQNAGKKHYIYCKDPRALESMYQEMKMMLPSKFATEEELMESYHGTTWRHTSWTPKGPYSISFTNGSRIEFRQEHWNR